MHQFQRKVQIASTNTQPLISTLPPWAGWLEAMIASTASASGYIAPAVQQQEGAKECLFSICSRLDKVAVSTSCR
jgi:hypothetical protein